MIEKLQLDFDTTSQVENITLEYTGVWQYSIGECPNTDWMIIKIKY